MSVQLFLSKATTRSNEVMVTIENAKISVEDYNRINKRNITFHFQSNYYEIFELKIVDQEEWLIEIDLSLLRLEVLNPVNRKDRLKNYERVLNSVTILARY